MRQSIHRQILTLATLVALGVSGCAVESSAYMIEWSGRAPVSATAQRATVVFMRPSQLGSSILILDREGTWLGEATASTYFSVTLPAGEQTFVGWGENTAALKATLVAGRVYYVKIEAEPGMVRSRVQLVALTKRSSEWSHLGEWLQATPRFRPLDSGRTHIARDLEHAAARRVRSASENWEGYTEAEKERRTLHADDGT